MPYAAPAQRELPYASGSDTSHDAAVVAGAFSELQRDRYLRWLQSRGEFGGTDGEAEKQLAMRRSSVCARRNELMKDGRIVKAARRRNGCQVWRSHV